MRPSHAIGLALVLVVATAAAFTGRTTQTPPAHARGAAASETSPAQEVRRLRDGSVRVNLPDGAHGAGACRKLSDGSVWVWTVAHVATHAEVTTVDPAGVAPPETTHLPVKVVHRSFTSDDRPAGRSEYEAVVVKVDRSIDVALLKLTAATAPVASLDFATAAPPLFTPLYCCGSPRGMDCTVTRGVFAYRDRPTNFGLMDQVDCPTLGGNSGGPVATHDGRIVGLLHGGVGEAFGLIVPARTVKKFAMEQGLLFAYEGDAPPAAAPGGPIDVTPVP